MTESPDFVRNQDFSRIFAPDNLLAVFLTQTLTQGPKRERAGKHRTEPDRIFPVWPCILLPYLPHLLADDPADGVGGVLLHLGRGVGVGVQREARRVVTQGPR